MYNGRWIIGANGPTFTETRHLRIECKPSAAETYIRPWMVYLDQGISAIPTNIRFTGLDVTQLQPTISYEFPNDDKEHESEAILSTAAKDLKYPNVGVA